MIMKFYSLLLAVFGVLRASSNVGHAAETNKTFDTDTIYIKCLPGTPPPRIRKLCPAIVMGLPGSYICSTFKVRCVLDLLGNDDGISETTEKQKTSPAPITNKKLHVDTVYLNCLHGTRPANIEKLCPAVIRNSRGSYVCSSVKFRCVSDLLRNNKGISETTSAPKTEEEYDRELAHKPCTFGKRPAMVLSPCPLGGKYTSDCRSIVIQCVKVPFANHWGSSRPRLSRPSSPPKTNEELDSEIANAECPFGQRSAKMAPMCPPGAKDTFDCPPIEVVCIQKSFGNGMASQESRDRELSIRSFGKTEKDLDIETSNKECTIGQRPVQVTQSCPKGARDIHDCKYIEVWCVREAVENVVGSTEPVQPGPQEQELKTMDELLNEMMHMICPPKHRPTLIKSVCPIGSKLSDDCPTIHLACRPMTFGNDQPSTGNSPRMEPYQWNMRHVPKFVNIGEFDYGAHPWTQYHNNGFRIRT